MKLGVAGLLGSASEADVRRIRRLGFVSASWHLPDLDAAEDAGRLGSVREALAREGVELCQLLPPAYPSLVDPDPAARRAGVEALVRCLGAAARLGAGSLYVRPGSRNPAGPWTPHPENHRSETRARLVESLRALVPHAEAAGVPLALEGHAVSPLDTPRIVRETLDAVGSRFLGFNADPVNFVRTIDQAYDSAALIDELFDRLGAEVVAAHGKDVTVEERLVVHIAECAPGEGHLDMGRFLRRFHACRPEGTVLIEHLPAGKVPAARAAMLAAAARAGVPLD